ncbi:MAG: ybaK [Sphingomonas bacterium]|nr:Cys-tRNA(Pro) deacylase [Sphingomonas bacterium]MDB5689246.1 ybaK [Sphingomonas bacterium]
MARDTQATRALTRAGAAFTVHVYAYDPDAGSTGLHAAEALGADPACVLKTLMAEVDGKPVCAVLPVDCTLSMKRLAAAAGGKAARMMVPAEAERLTGYKVGGISPLGQRRQVRTWIEAAALASPLVYVNGGQRGLQIRIAPAALLAALGAAAATLVA